jgi:hypothetical protein
MPPESDVPQLSEDTGGGLISSGATAAGAALGSIVPGVGTLIGGGLGALGGILGSIFAGPNQSAANAAYLAAAQEIQAVGAPPNMAAQIVLNKFSQAGLYTPALQQAIAQTMPANVTTNPSLQNAQMAALTQMQQVAGGGMNPQQLAALTQGQQAGAQAQQAQQQQIMQNMQARQMGGSGAEFAQRLMAAQGGANMASNAGIQAAGNASANALNAMSQGGNLANQIQGQQFSQNMQNAQLQNATQKFNIQNALGTQAANVQAQNYGNLYNLGTQQQLANLNTQTANADLYRQLQGQQQTWQDQMQQATALANAKMGQGNAYQNIANQTAGTFQGVGSGLGNAVSAYGNAANQANNTNALLAAYGGGNNNNSQQYIPPMSSSEMGTTNTIAAAPTQSAWNSGASPSSFMSGQGMAPAASNSGGMVPMPTQASAGTSSAGAAMQPAYSGGAPSNINLAGYNNSVPGYGSMNTLAAGYGSMDQQAPGYGTMLSYGNPNGNNSQGS